MKVAKATDKSGDKQGEKDRLALARLSDKARLAAKTGFAYSPFLSPAEQELALPAARYARVLFTLDGGFDEAERKMAFFHTEPTENLRSLPDFPIMALRVLPRGKTWAKAAPAHRDYLGAVLGLGLRREVLGDIVLYEGGAFLLAAEKAALFLAENLEKAASESVLASVAQLEDVTLPMAAAKAVSRTVSSLRLDALLAVAYNLSRDDAKTLALSGAVLLNHRLCDRPERILTPGDVLSVRGRGRVVLESVGNLTRKDRLPVTLEIF